MAKAKQRPAKKRGNGSPNTLDPRRGKLSYPVSPDWQQSVKDRLRKLDWTVKDLAQKIGAAQSTVHDLLNSQTVRYSVLVPAIHKAIGWDPPPAPGEMPPPLPSADAIELGHMYDRLPERIKKLIRDQAAASLELIEQQPKTRATPSDQNDN